MRKKKLNSFINVFGLSAALACFMMIMLWVQDELSYDRFHLKANRIFRITTLMRADNGDIDWAMTPPPLAWALKQIPQVQDVVRLLGPDNNVIVRSHDKIFNENDCFYADSSFFHIFSFPLTDGNPSTALSSPYSVVVSERIALKYFGIQDAIGKSITIERYDDKHEYVVTGVMKDTPHSSHFHVNFIASLNSLGPTTLASIWQSPQLYTYALLSDNASQRMFERRLSLIAQQNMGPDLAKGWAYHAQRLTDIHLHSHLLLEIETNGNIVTVAIFGSVGILLLLIAIINFISLSMAGYSERAKEVGLRKMLGASKRILAYQFVVENAVVILIAMLIAVCVTEMTLPVYSQFVDKPLLFDLATIPLILAVGASIASLGVVYPALILSSLSPLSALRMRSILDPRGVIFQKSFVVIQFAIVAALIVCALFINKQLRFVAERDLGMNIDQTVLIPLQHPDLRVHYDVLKNEFRQLSGVRAVSASSSTPSNTNLSNVLYCRGKAVLDIKDMAVDYDFLNTMGLNLLSGRNFSKDIATDSTGSIIVNESAARELDALGLLDKPLELRGFDPKRKNIHVIGVVKDFHFRPLYYPIEPMVFYVNPGEFIFMEVKIAPENSGESMTRVKKMWDKIVPNYPFEFTFLDEGLRNVYASDQRMMGVLDVFSILAILIACLGLLGLSAHTAERRSKEIGIRKVLGSSVGEIVLLLSKDFMEKVIIAGVIACAVSYFLIQKWLESFYYRISIDAWVFVGAVLLTAVIAFVTLSWQAIRAATVNPVESLRNE